MARSRSPLRRYATPRALKASASFSPLSWAALITDEQPSMRCVRVAPSSPSHQRCSCCVCAATDEPMAARIADSSMAKPKCFIAPSRIASSQRIFVRCICWIGLSFFRQRMQIAHQACEALVEHMRVDLCRRDVGMPKERLHDAQVGAVVQEVAGKSMTKHVRCHVFRAQAGRGGERLQFTGKMLTGDMTGSPGGREQPFRFREPACL